MQNPKSKTFYYFFYLMLAVHLIILPVFAQAPTKTLYERLGGVYNIAAVVDDFIDRLLADPVVTGNQNVTNSMGKITKPGLKYQVTELFCQATGGPQKYMGRLMKDSHRGLNITEAEWQAMMKDFLATLAKFNITGADQNELLIIVASAKVDIVTSQAVQPSNQVPQPSSPSIPVLPNPSNIIPSQIPAAPSIPALPNPENVIPQQVPQAPSIPTLPNPFNAPSPNIPVIPSISSSSGAVNIQIPSVPSLPILPNPLNAPSLVPPPPGAVNIQNPQPSTVPNPFGLPAMGLSDSDQIMPANPQPVIPIGQPQQLEQALPENTIPSTPPPQQIAPPAVVPDDAGGVQVDIDSQDSDAPSSEDLLQEEIQGEEVLPSDSQTDSGQDNPAPQDTPGLQNNDLPAEPILEPAD